MSNKFNHFIKNALLINLGVFALSIIVIMSYIESNQLSFDSLDETSIWNVNFDKNFQIRIPYWEIDIDNHSSQYDTIDIYYEDTFDVRDEIVIDSTIETIEFVHEDRDDIKVIFEREAPDTNSYIVDYSTKTTNDSIRIKSDLRLKNIFTDVNYKGLITFYVPMDYHCKTLTFESNFAEISDFSLPNSVDEVYIDIDFGDINFDVDQSIETLSIKLNAGNLEMKVKESIEHLLIDTDSSFSELMIDAYIDTISIDGAAGSIKADINVAPGSFTIESDITDIYLNYEEDVNYLSVSSNVGDVTITVPENDHAKVYKNVNFTDFSSDLSTVSDDDDANILVEMDMGAIDIRAIN